MRYFLVFYSFYTFSGRRTSKVKSLKLSTYPSLKKLREELAEQHLDSIDIVITGISELSEKDFKDAVSV